MITTEWLLNSILTDINNVSSHINDGQYGKAKEDITAMALYYRGIKDALAGDEEEAAPAGSDKMNLVYHWIKTINDLALKANANMSSVNNPTATKAISEITGMTKAVMLAVGGNNNG